MQYLKKAGWVLAGIVLFGIAVLVVGFITLLLKSSSMAPIPVAEDTTSDFDSHHEGPLTYTDSNFGFSLSYPSAFVPETPPKSAFGVYGLGYPIFSLPSVKGTYEQIKFTMYATTSLTSIGKCFSPPEGNYENPTPKSSIITINNVTFLTYEVGEPSTGQYASWETYKTLYNGKACVSIVIERDGVSYGHLSPKEQAVYETEHENMYPQFESVVKYFKFYSYQVENAVSGMSTYTSTKYGFSFSYPNGWYVSLS